MFGGGVTPMVDGVKVPIVSGLRISAIKDIVEATVEEVDPSISKSGAGSPNVRLFRSKYEKGGGYTLCLFGEGGARG